METTAVQAQETEGRWVLDNGESRLEVDPAQGGRLIGWDYTTGGQTHRLMDAPDARVSAGPVTLAAVGQAPEVRPTLGPASPSGLGDHFLPLTVAQRDFALGQARELGTFAGAAFTAEVYPTGREAQTLALRSVGGIRGAKRLTPITLYKRLTLGRPGGEISTHYRIENRDEKPLQIYFGVEFCFALSPTAAAGGPDFPAYEFDGRRERGGYGVSGVAKETTSVTLLDPQPGVTVRMGWEWTANVWVCPTPGGRERRGGAWRQRHGRVGFAPAARR
jgi:hypothetical protein